MENIYVLRSGMGKVPKRGSTITVTKTIVVGYADSYGIRDSEANMYFQGDWKWTYDTPAFWPPVAGDMIESNGIEYVALDNGTEMVLQPVTGDSRVIFSYDYPRFLETQPVLIRAASSR